MDLLLNPLDEHLFTPYVYPENWKEDDWERQTLSIFTTLTVGAYLLYFGVAGFAYKFMFDHELRKHPFFLKDQEWLEIKVACWAIPVIALYSTPLFVAEVRGYSYLYDSIEERGWFEYFAYLFIFLAWNDCMVYWTHRLLHHRLVYKHVHKLHHTFKVHTPFASLAFTPLDGFSQSLPYHVFIFMCPLHKITYVVSFVLIQLWTIFIHDHYYMVPSWLDPIVNGSKHHTDHHLYFDYNFGLYLTLWDRIGGTWRNPSVNTGKGPLDQIKKNEAKAQQAAAAAQAGNDVNPATVRANSNDKKRA